MKLRLTNTTEAMQGAVREIEAETWFAQLPSPVQGRVTLVLDELLSNIVKFAGQNVEIELETWNSPGQLALEIRDRGPRFDPRSAAPPPETGEVENLEIGGRGIQMVRRSVDRFEYRRVEGWNCVKVTFGVLDS